MEVDDSAWTNAAECRNYVQLRAADAMRQTVEDQSVKTDTDVEQRVPVTKYNKQTAKRIPRSRKGLIANAMLRTALDQSVKTDMDVEQRGSVTKRKKQTAKRIQKISGRVMFNHSAKRKVVKRSMIVHG